MADVFVSYAGEDRGRAERLIETIEQQGYSVSSDRNLKAGDSFEHEFERAMEDAQCVVVLWTRASTESEWVKREAMYASDSAKLLPVLMDDVEIPFSLRHVQFADLTDWTGETDHPRFRRFVDTVAHFVQRRPDTAHDARRLKEEQRRVEKRARDLFQRNRNSDIVIERVEFTDVGPCASVGWSLLPQVNVLLGRNGHGKSYLLRCILALLQYSDEYATETIGSGEGSISVLRDGKEETVRFVEQYFDEETAIGKVPILAIPDARFVNRSETTLGPSDDENESDLAVGGAWHFLAERPYEGAIRTFLYALCLDYLDGVDGFDQEIFDLTHKVVRQLTDTSFAFKKVSREANSDRVTLYATTEGSQEPLPIQKASQGTMSVLVMVGLVFRYLAALRATDDSSRVTDRTGIVFIDEIDAHLHPLWQRRILTLMRELFPRVQFVVTAHSPLVVAGCRREEVSVLRRATGQRGFSLVQFPNDFIGWEPEEIYERVFEVEEDDDAFVHYQALLPFKKSMEAEVESLAGLKKRTDDQQARLEELRGQLRNMSSAERRGGERDTEVELRQEIDSLRDRLLLLESNPGELDSLREAYASASYEAWRWRRIGLTASVLLLVLSIVTGVVALIK